MGCRSWWSCRQLTNIISWSVNHQVSITKLAIEETLLPAQTEIAVIHYSILSAIKHKHSLNWWNTHKLLILVIIISTKYVYMNLLSCTHVIYGWQIIKYELIFILCNTTTYVSCITNNTSLQKCSVRKIRPQFLNKVVRSVHSVSHSFYHRSGFRPEVALIRRRRWRH